MKKAFKVIICIALGSIMLLPSLVGCSNQEAERYKAAYESLLAEKEAAEKEEAEKDFANDVVGEWFDDSGKVLWYFEFYPDGTGYSNWLPSPPVRGFEWTTKAPNTIVITQDGIQVEELKFYETFIVNSNNSFYYKKETK